MTGTNRAIVILAAIGVPAVAAGALITDDGDHGLALVEDAATVECRGSIIELDFDPERRIEARSRGKTVAVAGTRSRRVSHEACTKAPTQDSWSQGRLRYTTLEERTTLICRVRGRFFVHVHPESPSWAGEAYAGSAVYLVLGRRLSGSQGPERTILASAAVVERPDESSVHFLRRYCTLA